MKCHRRTPVLEGFLIGSLGTETNSRKRKKSPQKKRPSLLSHKPGLSVNLYQFSLIDQALAS